MRRERRKGMHRSGPAVWIACAVALDAPSLIIAQQAAPAAPSPGRDIPRPDQLEPGVSNTTLAAPAPPSAPATSAAPPPTVAPAAPAATPAAASKVAPAAGDPAATGAAPARQGAATEKAATRKGPDRLELDATDITGNRELPKVLYIVPWKRSDLGDVVGRPVNSLLDEVLQPLDRDVFQRENRYYDGLQTATGDAKAGAAQGSPNKP
jgi:hypothetical protein